MHAQNRKFIFQTLLFLAGAFFGFAPSILPAISVILGWTAASVLISAALMWFAYEISAAQWSAMWIIPVLFLVGAVTFSILYFTIPQPKCLAFLEENGQVIMEAENYMIQLPGKPSSSGPNPERDATGITWQKNPDFPDALQALPDTQSTNTMEKTNGPALLYTVNFKTPGRYYVYIRGFGTDGNGDSIHFGLSGVPSDSYGDNFSLLSDPRKPSWMDKNYSGESVFVDVPTPGIYTFYVWMRENGVTIDKIWLDTGQGKVKSGDISIGPRESQCGR